MLFDILIYKIGKPEHNDLASRTKYSLGSYQRSKTNSTSHNRASLDSQHDNLPKGIRTIKMCKLYSNDALVTANGLASIVKENV